ncbi:uncharacterized protein NFIA_097560 [Aspergillus fischeri NRRL 181]|uniref:BTB domain-containing protein n=1 Tax=Neosartorya fischeri (strain ATCC 1020 / DSM 3700 / CBS 544.65 / FGSC A1164 / JCM 1740 / NRRL 181 / WB 181) TaxID=331117 RepID=A1DB88_NEOFI|nr:conserved hypothetical protein [Aspergillus fischeri NRRL 181]EAW20128.1 conserved hypothetical protein [Aspergillus fischeri NRRL 181]
MSDTCYEIDASGDIVLVLSAQRRASPKTSPAEGTTQARPAESTSPTSTKADTDTPIQKDAKEKSPNSEETTSSAVETPRARFKVSSNHLSLASNYFKNHLKKRISATSTADPPEEVHILDCDPEALLIVMNIIHNKGQQIPKELDSAMLLKVAAVVRYLDCLEACTFFFGVWIQRLADEVCDTWDNSLKWVYISWASNHPSLFTGSTSTTMSRRCPSSTYPADLNLPDRIKDDITKGWMTGSEKAKSVLSAETTRLKGETVYCHFCCDSLHLGAIIKATSHVNSSSLCSVHESLQSKTTHCTAGKPRCVNAASLLILKSALAKACTGEGLILQNYPLND